MRAEETAEETRERHKIMQTRMRLASGLFPQSRIGPFFECLIGAYVDNLTCYKGVSKQPCHEKCRYYVPSKYGIEQGLRKLADGSIIQEEE